MKRAAMHPSRNPQPEQRRRARRQSGLALLLAVLLFGMFLPQATAAPQAQAQNAVLRTANQLATSGKRNFSSNLGESGIDGAIRRALPHYADDLLEVNLKVIHRSVNSQGIDSLYRFTKIARLNVVEAKGTHNSGKIYRGILHVNKGGVVQMEPVWIRRNLDKLAKQADEILADPASTARHRTIALNIRSAIATAKGRPSARLDKTLVITRVNTVDPALLNPSRGIFNSVHESLRAQFDYIIERDKNLRVLAVYPKHGVPYSVDP